MIAQQFQSIQRLRAFADDVVDMFTNGQVVGDSDAENLDRSHAANARCWWRQNVSGLLLTVCEYNFSRSSSAVLELTLDAGITIYVSSAYLNIRLPAVTVERSAALTT